MLSIVFLLCALLLGSPCAEAKVIHLLPKPHRVDVLSKKTFRLNRPVQLVDETRCAYLRRVLEQNGCSISDKAKAVVKVEIVSEIPGAFNHPLPLYPDEAYQIKVTPQTVSIQALTAVGVIRAAQTLQQMAEGWEGAPRLEAVEITDWPAFKLRGFMHDVGRSFYSIDELRNQIDKLARFKVSTFHWHLTDNTGWRFQVKAFPQLTEGRFQGRYPGQYYTRQECADLVAFAKERGVTVIPEIDMPGHSVVFKKAMGFDMQTRQGIEALKKILDEACETFKDCPYIHIGGDEVSITYPDFLETMSAYVRQKGFKVVLWNPIVNRIPDSSIADMTQMWSTAGKMVKGMPNIDCRYNYTNHFDVYADLVGIYKSNIYYQERGSEEVAGTLSCAWNDTKVKTQDDITRQNNIYPNILASAERAWIGGGEQYIEKGGVSLPGSGKVFDEFADFERRLLFHKSHSLKDEPIAYVKQSHVRWHITDPFPNGGDKDLALPPELSQAEVLPTAFSYQGKTYRVHPATGAGIYLRHIWHPIVPSFFEQPAPGQTAYAWTYIYSEKAREVGAHIEFYTYSRSGTEFGAKPGAWDRRGSKIWLNDKEIPAPEWEQTDCLIHQDHATEELKNENLTARPVVRLHLRKGWNKVLMRLPHVDSGGTKRDKWQFTFVLTDVDGKQAAEGLVYSPVRELTSRPD